MVRRQLVVAVYAGPVDCLPGLLLALVQRQLELAPEPAWQEIAAAAAVYWEACAASVAGSASC